jgi:hypothetical protein
MKLAGVQEDVASPTPPRPTLRAVRRQKWDEEADAAHLVTAMLGGTANRVDPGGGAAQVHDFDVLLPGGRTIAVEVTRHNEEASHLILAEIDRRDWRFPTLRYDWVVDMVSSYNVKAIHGRIAAPLATLEACDVEYALLGDKSEDALPAAAREAAGVLVGLGARLVYRLGPADTDGGEVILSDSSRVGSTAPSVIVDLVEHHAARADNQRKLSAADDRSERHLFVWVESSQHAAVAAIGFSAMLPDGAGLPSDEPNLPDFVDAAWAVTAFDSAHVWFFRRDDGWQDLGVWRKPE